ncbi:MAG: hypothetical protein A3B96_01985 [Candidatus Spechtbacteria bacterium RIFCSPHIGHO2_02_FULL_43_15b]|uniref:tRNA/rRNA methyltransferase SpoU type domain-containing protein n=1 Tax=Candidatus Spechtbacteria bacterium RIFCSPHIGHO2_01_FULL_43_30 TaxID=1802158 RepID=A0A1G2H781_9BACT|nr:MAG: hypothetical protein A2827_03835 [Candidatus Spechtbacteria bacterium RIFCSPHIGHO2_01_FULL_43_30]OGZ59575.1 MAG: hypothetical protein A3B96_01985 [Candidatus Spechtbacteria bacterium RIFCSPHIGHO2_02_FULL_43_15b]
MGYNINSYMIAVLDNIRSGFNVGSILRTADAAGFDKVYLCGITPAPFDEFKHPRKQVTKVSLGAENYVSWEYAKQTYRVLDNLKRSGFHIFAVEQNEKSTPYFRINLFPDDLERAVLVVGSEIGGLSATILARADKILEIPMMGEKESLNVSVAFGIAAFHLRFNPKV